MAQARCDNGIALPSGRPVFLHYSGICETNFVNNFYSNGTSILRRSDPDAGERQRRIKQNPPHCG
jgi:hypothetical protein